MTFSDFIFKSKRCSVRELAIVRRQLGAPADGLREQTIDLVGILRDHESIPALASMIDDASEDDLLAIAKTFVALKRAGAEVKRLASSISHTQREDKREPLIEKLRMELRQAAKSK